MAGGVKEYVWGEEVRQIACGRGYGLRQQGGEAMKAKHARAITKHARTRREQREIRARDLETQQRQEADANYMRDEYPKFEASVYADIRKASAQGLNKIWIRDPRGCAWVALEAKLRTDGYHITMHHEAGEYENMGDFNAPCNLWRDPYWWYEVSW